MHLLAWEQEHLDRVVADIFGFHALQLGWPQVDGLRMNRMPHRWLANESQPSLPAASATGASAAAEAASGESVAGASAASDGPPRREAVLCEFAALPFPSQSLDLVVLPHTLEVAADPHHTLREVERVLVPDGRVVIIGLNPASLWGLRQRVGRVTRSLGFGHPFLPDAGEFLGYWRLRDWLRLLSFEIEAGRFGCYRPALRSAKWHERMGWMEKVGDRWWPVLGATYMLVAVKRVRGMRLIGPAWKRKPKAAAAPTVVTNSHTHAVMADVPGMNETETSPHA